MIGRGRLLPIALALVVGASPQAAAPTAPAPPAATHLTGAPQLAAVYDLILNADFDGAAAAAPRACPPAPRVACDLLDATALWWRIQLDQDSTALDGMFSERVERVIAAAEQWTTQEPRRAEAWFYLGAAYGARAQWRVLRAERLAAARDGKRIKDALEQATALDPQLYDARFGIGLYKYYADVAPAAARILRFLLLLPGGNRAEGLADMITARQRGALLQGEADYQLHWIYLWYEQQPTRGLELLQSLRGRYPGNPLFAKRIAEVQVEYFHDAASAATTWLALIQAAQDRRVNNAPLALTIGRLGAAEQLDALSETDRAIDLVGAVIAADPAAPYGSLARAYLLLGQLQDRMGRRDDAVKAYTAAIAARPAKDVLDIESRARDGLRRQPDARAAQAYRLSLQGWRAFERGAQDDAMRLQQRANTLAPADPVIEYRHGRVLAAAHEPDRALTAFGHVIAARPVAPAVFLARAYFERARLLEARSDIPGAIDAYRSASRVFGAEADTRRDARRALTRLDPPKR